MRPWSRAETGPARGFPARPASRPASATPFMSAGGVAHRLTPSALNRRNPIERLYVFY